MFLGLSGHSANVLFPYEWKFVCVCELHLEQTGLPATETQCRHDLASAMVQLIPKSSLASEQINEWK